MKNILNRTVSNYLPLMFLLALVFAYQSNSRAQEDNSVGIVTAAQGEVTVTDSKGTEPLAEGDSVYMGDLIKTGTDSGVKIVFDDESLIALGDRTELEINEFVYTPSKRKSVTSVTKGKIRALVSSVKDRESQVEFKTPNAVAGIKGTILYVNANTETIGVKEGEVLVKGNAPGAKTVTLGPNEYTQVVGGKPVPPKPLSEDTWLEFQRETNILEGVPDSTSMFRQEYPGKEGRSTSLPLAKSDLSDFPTVPPINLTPGEGVNNAVDVDIIVDVN